MGKKKFIDKKKAATFQLLARDTYETSHNQGPMSDHVFVRVDNNSLSIKGFEDDHNNCNSVGASNDPNSIFADAPGDEEFCGPTRPSYLTDGESSPLPDHMRREILELGFPDDGYNYLLHLREIKNTGGGSVYYQNPKANLEQLPFDVKAYDASRVQIKRENVEASEKTLMYSVSERTVNVRVQRAVDPEVLALLEDNESQLGSDIEDLEEDFVTQANLPDEGKSFDVERNHHWMDEPQDRVVNDVSSIDLHGNFEEAGDHPVEENTENVVEKPRVRHPIDEQFDLLKLREYDTDSEYSYDYCDFVDEEQQPLAEKLNNALKYHNIDDLNLDEHYKAPADLLHGGEIAPNEELVNLAADILRRCTEYAEKYENANEDDHQMVVVEENSDESDVWDCETIVSTYSNLDNHPGRIGAPETRRKKKLAETISGALNGTHRNIIHLGGKAKIPVDYLPHSRNILKEKLRPMAKAGQPKRKQHGRESKEEKKERKAAVKEEKREARCLKKETKALYRFESKQAQKVAAITGPSSIHLL